jgi:polyisoprenyl-phosphate glycosyltransferase
VTATGPDPSAAGPDPSRLGPGADPDPGPVAPPGPARAPGRDAHALVSLVSPVHDEAEGLGRFVARVREVMGAAHPRFELVLVDDGSRDTSWEVIRGLAAADPRVRGLRLSRNFGKEAAVVAGLAACRGEAAVVLDSDLQHPPSLLPELLERWREGYDVVEAVKRSRTHQPWLVRIAGSGFNRVFSRLTGVDLTDASDFRLLARDPLDAVRSLPERALFFRGTSTWIGYDRTQVPFEVDDRVAGATRWSLRSLVRLAVDGITSFTSAPLRLVTGAAAVFALFALALGVQTLVRFLSGDAVQGFTTVILLLLVQGTVMLLGLGIIGEYVARIHDEVKARPRYLVADRTEPGPDVDHDVAGQGRDLDERTGDLGHRPGRDLDARPDRDAPRGPGPAP